MLICPVFVEFVFCDTLFAIDHHSNPGKLFVIDRGHGEMCGRIKDVNAVAIDSLNCYTTHVWGGSGSGLLFTSLFQLNGNDYPSRYFKKAPVFFKGTIH